MLMIAVQKKDAEKKDADQLKHAGEMEDSRAQLQQLEGQSSFLLSLGSESTTGCG